MKKEFLNDVLRNNAIPKDERMKNTSRYKKGFREGYNNPKQHSDINLNNIKDTDDLINGIIAGVCKRRADIRNGINTFIWNDEDLNKKVSE